MNDNIIKVIKRDGREEPFSKEKMSRFLTWAASYYTGLKSEQTKFIVNDIIDELELRLVDRMPITVIYDQVIEIVRSRISDFQPLWSLIGRNLLLQKLHKELWGSKRIEYPDYKEVVKRGLESGKYDIKYFKNFTDDDLDRLGNIIDPVYDMLFTYGALEIEMKKYALKDKNSKYFELPQHIKLRRAIFSTVKIKDREERFKEIELIYKDKANMLFTDGTPITKNALTKAPQISSCVLMRPEDDSRSINAVADDMGIYSKYSGGLGVDIDWLRAKGRKVDGNNGISSGPIPFIKLYQGATRAYDQGGTRVGKANILYSWFNYEAPEITMLKDAGGKDDERARGHVYTIKWSRLFSKRILEDKDIALFDPYDVRDLLTTFGDEFNKLYEKYEKTAGIRKRFLKARDLGFTVAKVRSETGNIYTYFRDNVDEQRMGRDPITQTNLCTEVFLPVKPIEVAKSKLLYDPETDEWYSVEKRTGEIALCNLASINLLKWYELNEQEKYGFIYRLLKSFDDMIDIAFYPVKQGEVFNRKHRAIGIGVSNYAALLAKLKTNFTDDNALKLTHEIFEDLYYTIYFASTQLAKERGRYELFEGSKWEQGLTPYDVSIATKKGLYNYPLKKDWNLLRKRIREYGVRFEYHAAIAPTQTSGLAINATEGIEPILSLTKMQEGSDFDIPFIMPEANKYRQWYQSAWEITNERLIELAAIRQKFIDQGQSVNLYYKTTDSTSEVISDIILAESLGLKSLYYLKPYKLDATEETVCEACT